MHLTFVKYTQVNLYAFSSTDENLEIIQNSPIEILKSIK